MLHAISCRNVHEAAEDLAEMLLHQGEEIEGYLQLPFPIGVEIRRPEEQALDRHCPISPFRQFFAHCNVQGACASSYMVDLGLHEESERNFDVHLSAMRDIVVVTALAPITRLVQDAIAFDFPTVCGVSRFAAAVRGARLKPINLIFHRLREKEDVVNSLLEGISGTNPYFEGEDAEELVGTGEGEQWMEEIATICDRGPDAAIGARTWFARRVFTPILQAWEAYRNGEAGYRVSAAKALLANCKAKDWQRVMTAWLDNVEKADESTGS